jgi:hypothetical protein
MERWKIDEVLDLFKGAVAGNLIGFAKKVKQRRDWVAHRNPTKAEPDRVDSRTTYALLAESMQAIATLPR